jgi:hypothetical protein
MTSDFCSPLNDNFTIDHQFARQNCCESTIINITSVLLKMPLSKRRRASRGAHFEIHQDSDSSGSDSPRPHKNAHILADDDKENNADENTTSKLVSTPVEFVSRGPHRGCSGGLPVSESKSFDTERANNPRLAGSKTQNPTSTSASIVRCST